MYSYIWDSLYVITNCIYIQSYTFLCNNIQYTLYSDNQKTLKLEDDSI